MINRGKHQKNKKGAILRNTSRGGVIDTEALIGPLIKKYWWSRIAVLEGENLIQRKNNFCRDPKNPNWRPDSQRPYSLE
jgi:lactate dehydrogenase-like 2-hydroxyacid dehydrogenase